MKIIGIFIIGFNATIVTLIGMQRFITICWLLRMIRGQLKQIFLGMRFNASGF